ncbi:nucleoid-associated protein [Clostridium botulinum]|uniref:nucleoid-associated protein n=1 Tax=Clostridium botulinum TaxID=1491 RepID=UPI000C78AC3D|nr:nucleoid-associated protein [Clostridium botulinum]AUM88274.1 hypothetical protein RSJ15_11400 [Clostridium botulinum]NFM78133.1 nucleoid-associated protein [Clostridium botulinum]
MDNTTGIINIERAIIHTIKNDGKIEVKTYDNELDVSNNKNRNFIVNHIQRSLKSEGRKIAKFLDKKDNIISQEYNLLKKNQDNFIQVSKEITEKLGEAMLGTNGSSTYLLITIFTKDNIESLGILKLDFVENIELKEVVSVNGKMEMDLIFKDTGVPNPKQKLEKGAFISSTNLVNEDKDYDLVLLDKNKPSGTDYFKIKFLNCELVNQPKDNLINLFKTVNLYIEKVYENDPKITLEKNRLFRDYINSNHEIDVIQISNLINDDELKKEEFIDLCVDNKMDFEFEKDKDYFNRKFNQARYETDTGIIVEGSTSAMDDKEKIDVTKHEDGSYDMVIKNLKKISLK